MPILVEDQEFEVVNKGSVMNNILVLCEKFYNFGASTIKKSATCVDIFEGMKHFYAVANTNAQGCFKIPAIMDFTTKRDLKSVSYLSVAAYDDKSTFVMHLSMTSLIRRLQSGLRTV